MPMKPEGMKGQYFSFDAIVATVIVVLAITTLSAYWFSVQSVVEAKSSHLYASALRIGDILLSPGVPDAWNDPRVLKLDDITTLSSVQQLGLTNGYSNDINQSKVETLQGMAADKDFYSGMKKLLHADGYGEEVYVLVQQADDNSKIYQLGCDYATGIDPAYPVAGVAIAHRGGRLVFEPDALGLQKAPVPVRVLVSFWRQNQKKQKACF